MKRRGFEHPAKVGHQDVVRGSADRPAATTWRRIRYYRNGRRHEESSGSTKKSDAARLLKIREGDLARGLPVTPRVGRLRFDEAAADIVNDYKINGRRSLDELERRLRLHLTPYFGGRRMAAITTAEVCSYIATRQADTVHVRTARMITTRDGEIREIREERRPVSNGEINRELTTLKRAFNLAVQGGKLLHKPYIPLLKEHNVRTGFFEPDQFSDVCRYLSAVLRRMLTFAYITGWRIPSEIQMLQWRQIDFTGGDIRLDPGTTKNDDGRVFPMTDKLRHLLEEQWQVTRALATSTGRIYPWVFHRDGKPIKSFVKTWQTACRKAGCLGRIPHDFRRTAVRNLTSSGRAFPSAWRCSSLDTRPGRSLNATTSSATAIYAQQPPDSTNWQGQFGDNRGHPAPRGGAKGDRLLRKKWRRRPDSNRG